jgi:hypothetical protein
MKLCRDENIDETDNIFIYLLLVWACDLRHFCNVDGAIELGHGIFEESPSKFFVHLPISNCP